MAHTRQYPSAFPIAPLSASQPLGTGVGQRRYAGLGMPPFRRRRQWPAERLPLATLVPMDSRSGYRACSPIAVFTSLPNSPFPSLPTRLYNRLNRRLSFLAQLLVASPPVTTNTIQWARQGMHYNCGKEAMLRAQCHQRNKTASRQCMLTHSVPPQVGKPAPARAAASHENSVADEGSSLTTRDAAAAWANELSSLRTPTEWLARTAAARSAQHAEAGPAHACADERARCSC